MSSSKTTGVDKECKWFLINVKKTVRMIPRAKISANSGNQLFRKTAIWEQQVMKLARGS